MAGDVTYYALVGEGRAPQAPSGLARRKNGPAGPLDEVLRRDLTWQPDGVLTEWECGEVGPDVVEITEAIAERVIARFRAQWTAPG
jgi:hypothetical protein